MPKGRDTRDALAFRATLDPLQFVKNWDVYKVMLEASMELKCGVACMRLEHVSLMTEGKDNAEALGRLLDLIEAFTVSGYLAKLGVDALSQPSDIPAKEDER